MEFIKLLWFLVVCEERGSCFLPSSFQICPSYFLCLVLRLCCCRCHISHKLQNQVAWPFLAQTWRTVFFKSVFHKMQVQTLITYVVLLNGSILLSPRGFDHLSSHPAHSQTSGKFLQAQREILIFGILVVFGGLFFFKYFPHMLRYV